MLGNHLFIKQELFYDNPFPLILLSEKNDKLIANYMYLSRSDCSTTKIYLVS